MRSLVEAEREGSAVRMYECEQSEPYSCEGIAGAFFCFTSNIDAHSFDVFQACEIRECHGNVEIWQCSDWDCGGRHRLWRAPLDCRFHVNSENMLAPPDVDSDDSDSLKATSKTKIGADVARASVGHTFGSARLDPLKYMAWSQNSHGWHTGENSKNYPKCSECVSLARPAILMFGDFDWKDNEAQMTRWIEWKTALYQLCSKRSGTEAPLRVCILEIGCGLNVATCRSQSEVTLTELREYGGEGKLVRINPDFPLPDDDDIANDTISIMAGGLESVQEIDKSTKH